MPLLLLFIVMPVLEIWLLFKIGAQIGALPTIALVLLTAMLGLRLLRQQGMQTYVRLQQKMQQGQPPAQEMLEALALAIGGALLLTPGFVTDGLGLMCLLPYTRRSVVQAILTSLIKRQAGSAGSGFQAFHGTSPFQDIGAGNGFETEERESHHRQSPFKNQTRHSGNVIEGDFKREDKP